MRDTNSLLEVAIEAKGISPRDVPVRQLVELLEAAVSALDAVARQQGLKPPVMRLVGVREGSAAYEFTSDSDDASDVVHQFYEVTKKRGVGCGPEVRKALTRLHSAARVGRIRITSHLGNEASQQLEQPIYVEPPVHLEELHSEMAAEYYGRVVALSVKNEKTFIRMHMDDGGTREYEVVNGLEQRSASFFNKTVRIHVVHTLYGDAMIDGRVEAIEAWANETFLDVMRSVRENLTEQGVTVDVEAWLRELDA